MMTKTDLAARLRNACAAVIAAEQELTEIDSKFGDADHGLTMSKIARAVTEAVDQSEGGIQAMLDDAATAVMSLNGGSAVPLWNTWLDGMQEAAPEGEEIDVPGLQALFAKALEELNDMSGAQVGDKTMMDALIPASRAIAAYAGSDEDGLFAAAAKAAAEGAENSKNFVSKFGRAKSYGTQTIGTPDAGAMSMSYFFQGLAQA
ncbi:DAK2 domain-containing protein [uncultured Oscillibacter sp.]|uniref:DAK2 domain-containing protein n=1 Tax=uncultured Oscillibacter sp. TaxID=876091 RepID=UPI001F88502C|nr:DAK2 domain-containing protein [uncultured Oscillibacter sp.]HJB31613.1 DAK2 domain-containing protein [Candidatus Oscillibacter excrementavium]